MKDNDLRFLLDDLGLISVGYQGKIHGSGLEDLHLKVNLIVEHLKLEFVETPDALALQKRKKR